MLFYFIFFYIPVNILKIKFIIRCEIDSILSMVNFKSLDGYEKRFVIKDLNPATIRTATFKCGNYRRLFKTAFLINLHNNFGRSFVSMFRISGFTEKNVKK